MKKALIAIIVIAALAVGGYFFYQQSNENLQGNMSAKERIKQATDPISAKSGEDVKNIDKAGTDSDSKINGSINETADNKKK